MANPLIDHLPAPVQAALRLAVGRLSPEQRRSLERWLPGMGGNITGVKDVARFITDNYRAALHQGGTTIAIVGPANVGKSTLYNQLITSSEERAAVTPVPGTTRANQAGSGGIFTVVDTPGADAVGQVGDRERGIAFSAARDADFLVILFDAGAGVSRGDRELFDALTALGKPYVAVLNKMDLVRKADRVNVIESAAANLGIDTSQLIDIVATKGDHVGHVVLAVAQADPRLLIALADALPAYRARLAWQRIIGAATASASVALLPLPMADVLPLLGVQTGLVLTIGRIYGYNITPARARELIATFGVAFAARAVQRQLAKLLGAPGWVLSAAVAASATVAMGYAAMTWFERGEKPTQAALQKLMQEVSQYLRDQLTREGKSKPSLRNLRARVQAALEGLPERFRP